MAKRSLLSEPTSYITDGGTGSLHFFQT